MPNHDPSMAETLGKGYAHVQHLIDKAIGWGFKEMRKAAATKPTKAEKKSGSTAGKISRAARSTFKFFGEAGDAYFQTYEDLKRKKS